MSVVTYGLVKMGCQGVCVCASAGRGREGGRGRVAWFEAADSSKLGFVCNLNSDLNHFHQYLFATSLQITYLTHHGSIWLAFFGSARQA